MRDNTLVKMVDNRADRYGDRTVLERKVNGTWESISWDYLARTYREVGRGLLCLGLEGGDRVAILSENRPEWAFADLGILSMDGVVVPLYWTLTPAQLEYILRDCAAKNSLEAADIIHPARFALTSETVSPSIFDVFAFLGKEESVRRIEGFVDHASGGQGHPRKTFG